MQYFKKSKQKRFLRVILILFFLLSGFINITFAQEKTVVQKFGLNDCINYALKNQATVRNRELAESISQENVKEVYSRFLPQISAGANYQYTINRQVMVIDNHTIFIGLPHQLHGFVDVNQTLFNPALLGSSSGARLQANLSKENTSLSKIDVVAGVMKAFYGVLVFREQLNLLSANITRTEKSLHDTKYQYKNGLAQKVDVDRIQVLVNNAVTQKANALRNLKTLMQSLKYYMGMPVKDSLDITGTITDSLLTEVSPITDGQFYKNRVEYLQAKTGLAISQLLKSNVIRSYLPTLSALYTYQMPFYGHTFRGMFDETFHPTSYVGLQLAIPVFSGLKKHYQYEVAKMNVEISKNNLFNLKNSIELEYNKYYRQYKNDMDNLKTQKENIKLAQLNYDNLKYQYDNGVQPLIGVLNAETTLLQAQDNYINALYEALINKVDLDKSLGKINY